MRVETLPQGKGCRARIKAGAASASHSKQLLLHPSVNTDQVVSRRGTCNVYGNIYIECSYKNIHLFAHKHSNLDFIVGKKTRNDNNKIYTIIGLSLLLCLKSLKVFFYKPWSYFHFELNKQKTCSSEWYGMINFIPTFKTVPLLRDEWKISLNVTHLVSKIMRTKFDQMFFKMYAWGRIMFFW